MNYSQMTLQEILNLSQETLINQNYLYDNPLTFDDLIAAGFTKPAVMDEATWESIKEYFGYRRVQYHFDRFFNRSVNMYYPYYKEMLTIDPSVNKTDWFVEIFRTRTGSTISEGTNSVTETTNSESTGTNTNNITGTHNGTTNSQNTSHNEVDGTTTSATTANGSSNDVSKKSGQNSNRTIGMTRQAPANASYNWSDTNDFASTVLRAGSTQMVAPGLNGVANPHIMNPSVTSDGVGITGSVAEEANTNTNSNTSTQSGTSGQTSDGTDKGNVTSNDTTTTTITGSTDNTVEASRNTSAENGGSVSVEDQVTGRNNKLSEMIMEAKACLFSKTSFEEFAQKLDQCFMQAF